ncbi:hypothetical protein K438DRAFT_84977 [Mycena galopus ATCC 62051]|nr:hypothetical protein K438DRAFT_84977 [Mycena galopus ATCC 62051]
MIHIRRRRVASYTSYPSSPILCPPPYTIHPRPAVIQHPSYNTTHPPHRLGPAKNVHTIPHLRRMRPRQRVPRVRDERDPHAFTRFLFICRRRSVFRFRFGFLDFDL